jgi:hypothetical protein
MKNRHFNDEWWFDAIGSCIVLAGGTVFAALLYEMYAIAVPLVERALDTRGLMSIGW